MSKYPSSNNSLGTIVKKFFLSAFVVITFLAYMLHERFTTTAQANQSGNSGAPSPSNGAETSAVTEKNAQASVTTVNDDNAVPVQNNNDVAPASQSPNTSSVSASGTVTDTPTPQPVSHNSGTYKDGTYTGTEADAYYGLVQVQAVIQNGRIASVSFLEYPNHRRTSVEINTQVMPWLQQEAIQAQSAQVNLISGATLTSQAFAESLRVALNSARN